MLSQDVIDKLNRLPMAAEAIWEGGRRELKVWIAPPGRRRYRPDIVAWVDPSWHKVLGSAIIEPNTPEEIALEHLVTTMQKPMIGSAVRPGEIRVSSKELQRALQKALHPLGIRVSFTPKLTEFDTFVRSLEAYLRREGEGPGYVEEGASPKMLAGLFHAAAAYYRDAPWTRVTDGQPLAVTLNRWGVETVYCSVMGNAGITYGLAAYYKLSHLKSIYESHGRMSKKRMRAIDSLSVTFGRADKVGTRGLDEIADHQWEIAGPEAYPLFIRAVGRGEIRGLNREEIHILQACLYAVMHFVSFHKLAFTGVPLKSPISEEIVLEPLPGKPIVTVSYPPPDSIE
jgi:hypothetical protein